MRFSSHFNKSVDSLGTEPSFVGAVNDPSVTKHWNAAANDFQWTMFYTAAVCNDQIWSSVSFDSGHTWGYHQLVVRGNATDGNFTAAPSALWKNDHWQVYYAEVGCPQAAQPYRSHRIFEMDVSWDRRATSDRFVFPSFPSSICNLRCGKSTPSNGGKIKS